MSPASTTRGATRALEGGDVILAGITELWPPPTEVDVNTAQYALIFYNMRWNFVVTVE